MASRDFTVAVVAGLVAGVPFVVAALDEMADEGPDGPYSNDAYGALLDWSALVLLVPLPFLLARYATLPLQAGLVAGAIASVGAFVFIFTVGRVERAAEFAFAPLVVFPPVGFGALAGTWALLARRGRVPRWAAAACAAALLGIVSGFLSSLTEGGYSIGGLPTFPLAWVLLALAAIATSVLAWRKRERTGKPRETAPPVSPVP